MREQKKQAVLFLLMCFLFFPVLSLSGYAQESAPGNQIRQNEITGKVTDQSGEALLGVSVSVKGTTEGIVTDIDGNFSLKTTENHPTLIFSYVGFQTIEKAAQVGKHIVVVMNENNELLDEIVVVGYGVQKKATLTGAIVAVNSEQLTTSTNSNLQQNLAGKLAGVKVITNSSEPGSLKSKIDVRGMGTPLIVIDGVASDIETFSQLSAEEVENISVLKDASASIYGMRAGNGVMVVTTKKGMGGRDGKPKFEYRGVYGWNHMLNMPESMNAYDWASMINDITESRYSGASTTYSKEQLESYKGVKSFDMWDQFMNDYSPQTEHTLSVSGSAGTDNDVNYFFTGSYLNEDGAYKSGSLNYERFNFRSNVSAKLGYGLTANVNVGLIKTDKKQPYQDAWNIMKWMWYVPPVHPETGEAQTSLYANNNPDYPAYLGTELNPVVNSDSKNGGGFKTTKENTWNVQGSLQWDVPFAKGLTAKFMYNYNRRDKEYKAMNSEYTLYTYKDGDYVPKTFASPSAMTQEQTWSTNRGYQASLNYIKSFDLHNLNVLALFEQNQYNFEYIGAKRLYTMDFLDYLAAGDNDKTQSVRTDFPKMERRQGLVGRVNYDFAGRYMAEVSFRYDGSSKYHSDKQWGFFPSGSLGWRISEEQFFKNVSALSFIDNLKLRASYGITGDDGGANYQWASGYTYPGKGIYYFGSDKSMSVNDRGAVNTNFTWYENKITNIGLDFNAWNGLLGVTTEMFSRKREGLPAKRELTIPGTVGIGLPEENLNSDRTSGWEITLTHQNKIGEVTYDITGNVMYARTKNLHVEQAKATSSYKNWRDNKNDRYNDIWWLMEWAGVIKPGTDISSLPNENGAYQNSVLSIGDYYHTDLNGDGYVDDEDKKPLRTLKYPAIQYGITIGAAWRGFDLNLHFMGAAEKYVLYNEFLKTPYAFSGSAGALNMHLDRWHQDESGNWISGYYPRYSDFGYNYKDDTRRAMNASYLRLKSAEIGYTVPKQLIRKLGIERLRVYANGFNLFTITGLKNMDPEYPGWNVENPASGDDTTWGYIYPVSMNFNFGVNVTF
ncbi:TonB-linked SusC/RagA family outer membrane protein [Parabacteroides sp. PF5-5]|uniref:SusC/RagA family TonB-linked outer membrane protein n=1 Tax=unclassified Parabacteroides TaxID=2649774 RepID=UPI00247634D3|nr:MULTISPECIES: TonB-dependent receptor [unclassified Parabacteroides]MDH6304861.1 TonB-linked SusC/RagA family outer membrane protein [Parabacteroides sp. PH5-39]MDH6316053.1 TonB-linked SusC/RagA family outer membrane protein [Parabacteroides sp. PF5-13]MDH6319710.1 TonB-linked SusC/RagA family outer membrane protein [Parabacteroides sp. PH5-13]MDH6323441.1 TonB-linked SusC/RagA family outer membrane protein [Parabacteroides sp. PH5-8]MDH6327051.1 TonB-linked SusC/RagA family outer membrane